MLYVVRFGDKYTFNILMCNLCYCVTVLVCVFNVSIICFVIKVGWLV